MAYKDREKQLEAQRKHYRENKAKYLERNRIKKAKVSHWYYKELLPSLACEECGFKHPAAIDFHHRDPAEKEYTVSQMLRHTKSIDQIKAEIAKCDALCANCHRIHHYNEKHGPIAQQEEASTSKVEKCEFESH